MKKILIASILVLMLVPAAMAAGVSFQPGMYQSKTNVNVRILPRFTSARINHLHKGETVNVKRVVGGWCEIDLKKYKHAYVNCSLLEAGSAGAVVAQAVTQTTAFADYNGVDVSKNPDGSWSLGSRDAKVVMEEFGDMQCPFCGRFFVGTFSKIFIDYIETGKVRYVYYNFPLSFHPGARSAAMASLCAGEQDKFWQMHAMILEKQIEWGTENDVVSSFDGYAKDLGLNTDNFGSCIDKDTYAGQLADDLALAEKRGVFGTPMFYINGTELMGSQPYEVFSAAIDGALEGK